MKAKSTLAIAVAGILAAALISFSTIQAADADHRNRIAGKLSAPSGGNPFGGDEIGAYKIVTDGHKTRVSVDVEIEPAAGMVHEGWLVDAATGYKLSLGLLDDDSLHFRQNMVNPFTYNMLVITEEPKNDADPNPATPVGGALLPDPFGI